MDTSETAYVPNDGFSAHSHLPMLQMTSYAPKDWVMLLRRRKQSISHVARAWSGFLEHSLRRKNITRRSEHNSTIARTECLQIIEKLSSEQKSFLFNYLQLFPCFYWDKRVKWPNEQFHTNLVFLIVGGEGNIFGFIWVRLILKTIW